MPLSALLAALVLGQKGTDPFEILRRALDPRPRVNVEAWMEKPFRGGDTMSVLLRSDAGGRRRTEVLAPLAMQGRVFIDDGASYIAYFPDRKLVEVHPARPDDDDLDRRFALVRKNYRLEIEGKTKAAGRSALVLVATPHESALRTQRFTVDAATSVPLKAESVDGLGNTLVRFRISRIVFPVRFDRDAFAAPEGEGIRRETRRPPMPAPFRGPEDAARRLGFAPILPWRLRLPLGFRPQGRPDILDWHGVSPLATPLTDGLVRLIVFQFRPDPARPPRPGDEKDATQDVDGVRVVVRGDDAPPAVRERILAAYVKALQGRAKAQEPPDVGR